MMKLAIGFALLGVVSAAQATLPTHGSVGIGHGITLPSQDSNPCGGWLFLNFDGSAENGYCWQYGGIVPPYYGAFAECYNEQGSYVCGIELLLTGVGYPCYPCDLYVWDDDQGHPGNVLSMTTGANPCPVATWPNISTHDFSVNYAYVNGAFWAGFWANASYSVCPFFVAADLDGLGGCPYTNIAPGIGYPTGWQNVSTVWGPTQALGIGVWCGGACCGGDDYYPGACCYPDGHCEYVYSFECATGDWRQDVVCDPNPCQPVPVHSISWGRVKTLYR